MRVPHSVSGVVLVLSVNSRNLSELHVVIQVTMASVKYSGLITELKGSVGGSTFQSSKSGFSVRNKPNPRNRRTSRQSVNRISVATLSQVWRNLSESGRLAWETAAPNWPATNRYGDTILLSGFDVFMSSNLGRLYVDQSPNLIAVNPAALNTYPGPSMVISVAAGTALLTWSGVAVQTEQVMDIRCTRMMSAGRGYRATGFVSVTKLPSGTASSQDLWSALVARLGQSPVLGSKIWFEQVIYSTTSGNKSAPVPFSAIVAA